MAYFGLSAPRVAKYTVSGTTESYSDGFTCGKAISTTVTPNAVEGSLYADNQQVEYVNEFQNASVSIGCDRLPKEAATVMFGHTVSDTDGTTYKSSDAPNYVGYGFCVTEMVDGTKQYRACVLPKVKFAEGEDSYQTKGDSITFSTPELSGTALPDLTGAWKYVSKAFTTEADAISWIETKLNITAAG